MEADVWIGLKSHWKIEAIDLTKALRNEKQGEIIHLIPTKFLGRYEFSNTISEEELITTASSW